MQQCMNYSTNLDLDQQAFLIVPVYSAFWRSAKVAGLPLELAPAGVRITVIYCHPIS